MEFQVSARKWRPQKFSELIGQEHIVRTISNSIELNRVAHAYLFSGTRGVGKTTTARLLAKALNCVKGPTPEPCDECDFCRDIREGRSVDVQEIDGASNNGVAEVRDLIENVQYTPAACRFKVYIIDEVHMLSKSAFNALLKTLEEPPPGVVFIFATTELQKIPDTILSRCQCFEFKPLSNKQIKTQLQLIAKHDGIEIDAQSLEEIAKNGAGSMRDSQSLLDQVIAFCGKKIDSGAVESILGIVGSKVLETFVERLIQKDPAVLETIREVVDNGKNLHYFCRDLIEYIRNLMLVKIAPKPETLLDTVADNIEILKRQAGEFHADELHQMFNILSRAEDQMKRNSLPRMIFEMAVIRLLDVRPFQDIDDLIQKINQMEGGQSHTGQLPTGQAPSIPTDPPQAAPQAKPVSQEPGKTAPSGKTSAEGKDVWAQIKTEIRSAKRSMDHFFANSQMFFLDKNTLHLGLPDPYTLQLVEKEENIQCIKDAVKKVCDYDDIHVKLDLLTPDTGSSQEIPELSAEEKKRQKKYDKLKSPSEDEILKDALDIFGGMVIR